MPRSQTVELPIDVGVYQSESLPVANQLCKNLIPWQEQTEGTSTRGFLTYGFGIESRIDLDGVRAFHVFNGVLYAVAESKLYQINSDYSTQELGTFTGDGSNDPEIDDNGDTMVIQFPSGTGWFYDSTNGLVEITDPVYTDLRDADGGMQSVRHVDGFFVYLTNRTLFSGSVVTTNGGKDFDALDFLEPFLNDEARAIEVIRGELYCFGENRTKVYSTFGTGSFPFVEIDGAGFDKGIAKVGAVVVFDNSAIFIGGGQNEQNSVWRIIGGGAVSKISTPFIDSQLNQSDDLFSDIFSGLGNLVTSFTFNIDGHFYAGFTFGRSLTILGTPIDVGAGTFVYDATSSALKGRNMWHQRQGPSSQEFWDTRHIAEAYGQYFTAAKSLGIGTLSKGVYTEYGQTVDREFSGYYLENRNGPLFIDSVELVAESGVGNEWTSSTTVDRNPSVELEISDDGGRTFFSVGTRQLGSYLDYRVRTKWEALGMAETTRLFKFSMNADVKAVFQRLLVSLEAGY